MDNNLTSCEFLLKQSGEIFVPESFDGEMQMIVDTCNDFLNSEIFPIQSEIDEKEDAIMTVLLRKSAELGLLGLSISEQYGGFQLPFASTIKASEVLGSAGSFSVAHMCHVGIGSMPIVCYGTDEQKAKYLPDLASGNKFSCFCLTEPNAGSDANAGRTVAVPSADGTGYILNGQKVFITNSGFADIQIVFAKVEDDRVLSAFIVERAWNGVSVNTEEHKMGIRGTSTRQIFYNNVFVPAGNMLGKRGEGYRIALNILHLGRIKLSALTLGASKKAIDYSVAYAKERKQFGKSISEFGAIRKMLAEQAVRTYELESMLYRTAGQIQHDIDKRMADGEETDIATINAIADYQSECAMLKVFGSETQDSVVDNAVQIHGGIGYVSAMPIERAYRDSRINRIYEGTNEINRLLAVDYVMKRASRNRDFPLFESADNAGEPIKNVNADLFERQNIAIANLKQICNLSIKAFHDKFGAKSANEQELMEAVFDMMTEILAAESTLLRVGQTADNDEIGHSIVELAVFKAQQTVFEKGLYIAGALGNHTLFENIRQHIGFAEIDAVGCQRIISNKLIADNTYKL